MKVFLVAPKEDWICDRIAQEWNEYFPEISVSNYNDADVIWGSKHGSVIHNGIDLKKVDMMHC